jgi:hypothetical protein
MLEDHIPEFKSLSALKMDWGRNEKFNHIPKTNMEFSKKLEALSIKHFTEENAPEKIVKLGNSYSINMKYSLMMIEQLENN